VSVRKNGSDELTDLARDGAAQSKRHHVFPNKKPTDPVPVGVFSG
jgi:hypothetical protein